MFSGQTVPQMGLTLLLLAVCAVGQQSSVAQEAAMYHETVPLYLLIVRVVKAHGAVMGLSFAFLYPMGAIMVRLLEGRSWALKLHGYWQMVAWTLTVVGFGTGLWLVHVEHEWHNMTGHPIIGTVVVCIVILMPVLGHAHHVVFVKKGYRNVFTYLHVWIGRPTLVLGGINGGLGIWFYHDMPFYSIYVYSIVAGVMYIAWFASSIYWNLKGPLPPLKSSATDVEKGNLGGNRDSVVDDSVGQNLVNMKEVDIYDKINSSSSDSVSDGVDSKTVEAGVKNGIKTHSKDPNRFPFSNRQ